MARSIRWRLQAWYALVLLADPPFRGAGLSGRLVMIECGLVPGAVGCHDRLKSLDHLFCRRFTNDLALEVHHADDQLALGGSIFHRMITANDLSRRRWDQLDLRATLAWRWRPTVELGAWLRDAGFRPEMVWAHRDLAVFVADT